MKNRGIGSRGLPASLCTVMWSRSSPLYLEFPDWGGAAVGGLAPTRQAAGKGSHRRLLWDPAADWQLTASSHREAGSVVEPIIQISKLRLRERKLLAGSPARSGGIRHRTWVHGMPRPRACGRARSSMAASSNPSAVGGIEERSGGAPAGAPPAPTHAVSGAHPSTADKSTP